MNITEEQYELAERYLAGLLSGKELADFKKMLEENPDLKDQTDKIRKVNELMFMEGLKTELPAIQKAQEQYMFRQQLKYYGKWLGGFMVVAAITTVLWNFSDRNEVSTAPSFVVEKKQPVQDSVITSTNIGKKAPTPFSSSSNVPVKKDTQSVEEKNNTYYKFDILPTDRTGGKIVLKPDSIEKKTEVLNKEDPCKEQVNGLFETTASCENKSEGSIRVKSVSGGTKPYYLSIDQGNYRETTFFQFLTNGEYELIIKDANGCTSKSYTVKVPVKICTAAPKDYVFSYQNTQEFTFPDLEENDFSFQVYNNAGGMEYSVKVTNGVPFSWNGYSATGQKLTIGSYSIRFITPDNRVLQQGTITIVD